MRQLDSGSSQVENSGTTVVERQEILQSFEMVDTHKRIVAKETHAHKYKRTSIEKV